VFLVYLTKHTQILTLYMQAIPEVHKSFIQLTMPQIPDPEVENFHSKSFPPAPKVWVSKTCSMRCRDPNSWELQLISFAHREDCFAGMESLWLLATVACATRLSLQQGHYGHHLDITISISYHKYIRHT
jgi:hypothetical protein